MYNKYTKTRLRPGLGRKRIFFAFGAQRTCLTAANVVVPLQLRGANSAPFAGFQGPLRGGGKKETREGKEWKEKERKAQKGFKGWDKNTPRCPK